MAIAFKESRETYYWLKLLRDSDYLAQDEVGSILKGCDELIRMLTSIVKTLREKWK